MQREGKSRERAHDRLLSDKLQHPDWPSLRKPLRVFAHNTNQAGPSKPYVRVSHSNNRPIIIGNLHRSAALFRKKSCSVPREACRQASRQTLRSYCVLRTQRCHPANNKHQHGRRAEPRRLLLPLHRG